MKATKKYSVTIKGVEWFPLRGSQECSYRLGFKDEIPKNLRGICCQPVYDIAYQAVKEMAKAWNLVGRKPHWNEIEAGWTSKPDLKPPFYCCPFFKEIAKKAHKKIIMFYMVHLGRKPDSEELLAALRQCFIKPGFEHKWGMKVGTKAYKRRNYDARYRRGVSLCKAVEVGKCVICGESVLSYDGDFLKDAGEIEMSFGYGSRRDCDYLKGFIHDLCSVKLQLTICKHDFTSNHPRKVSIKSLARKKIIYEDLLKQGSLIEELDF